VLRDRWTRLTTNLSMALRRLAHHRSLLVCVSAIALAGCVLAARAASIPTDFLITSIVVAAIPGTGVLYTVSSAIGGGWRRGVFATVGCTLGIVPHIVAAMLGLSGVMQIGATVFEVIRWVGVVYLLAIGIAMLRSRADALGATDQRVERWSTVVRRGVLVNLLNPKLTLFFFAFLPQFLDASPSLLDGRLILLGVAFMVATFVVFLAYASTSAVLRDRVLAAPRARKRLQRTLGAVVVGFGLKLAADR
jgi:threonine/homoserine/homoserine lactone efflux protein